MGNPADGVHDLVDERAVERLLSAAPELAGRVVMDAGAGTGHVTKALARRVGPAGRVVAVEKDPQRAEALGALLLPGVEVVVGDLLTTNVTVDAVVANPPFRIVPTLLRQWATAGIAWAVLVVPLELAERLTARVGDERYGKLSVWMGLAGRAEIKGRIPRRAFDPPPAVPCAIVLVHFRTHDVPEHALGLVLDAAWAARTRHLRHSLAGLADSLRLPPQTITACLQWTQASGRPFAEVSPWEFGQIARALHQALAARGD